MTELKTGDLVLVSSVSVESAKARTNKRVFLYTAHNGQHICQTEKDYLNNEYDECFAWEHAIKPPRTELRVKKASEIMRWLEEHGYEINSFYDWEPEGKKELHFNKGMWVFCGKPPGGNWQWNPMWLEEVEVA